MGFLATIKSLFGIKNSGDRTLVCQDCDNKFIFDEGEQRFFKSKGFTDPKRCPGCRKKAGGKGHRKHRGRRNHHKRNRHHHHHRHDSVIDGRSPYADE